MNLYGFSLSFKLVRDSSIFTAVGALPFWSVNDEESQDSSSLPVES